MKSNTLEQDNLSTRQVLLVLVFFLIVPFASCQDTSVKLDGTWQFNTPNIGSGLLDNYKFYSDSNVFIFNTNEYNGLNRIISLGGKYEIGKDSIHFTVEYTIEYIDGYPIRSMTTTLSDTWELIEGDLIRNNLDDYVKESARFIHYEEFSDKQRFIEIDGKKYFKIDIN